MAVEKPEDLSVPTSALKNQGTLVPVAIAFIVCCVLWIFCCLLVIGFFYSQLQDSGNGIDGPQPFTMYISFLLVMITYSLMIITGAISMIRKGSYVWASVCSYLVMVPFLGPFYFLGIPLGVWAILMLRKPHVRDSFGRR